MPPCARCGTPGGPARAAWYAECGVADTLAGRFDAITLVLSGVAAHGSRGAQGPIALLTELFVTDMDGQLRERAWATWWWASISAG
jgi:cytochrome b pre-mRNA-processing protein 3